MLEGKINLYELVKNSLSDDIIIAIKKVTGNKNIWIDSYGICNVDITPDQLEEIKSEIENTVKARLKKEILNTYNKYNLLLKKHISGDEVSMEQLEEYEAKAKAIEENDVAYFEVEAAIMGVTAEELFEQSKAAGEIWNAKYKQGLQLLGGFRRKLNSLLDAEDPEIEDNIDYVIYLIKYIKKLGREVFNSDFLQIMADARASYLESIKPEEVVEEVKVNTNPEE